MNLNHENVIDRICNWIIGENKLVSLDL